MKDIQEALRAYLAEETGIRTICGRSRVKGDYPLLAVTAEERGTVLLAGGALAEHSYGISVTAVSDREREETAALLSGVTGHLLRGVPMETEEGLRTLHPLNITTEGEELTFTLEVCRPVPPRAESGETPAEPMQTLHFGV